MMEANAILDVAGEGEMCPRVANSTTAQSPMYEKCCPAGICGAIC